MWGCPRGHWGSPGVRCRVRLGVHARVGAPGQGVGGRGHGAGGRHAVEVAVTLIDDVLEHVELLLFLSQSGAALVFDPSLGGVLEQGGGYINTILI